MTDVQNGACSVVMPAHEKVICFGQGWTFEQRMNRVHVAPPGGAEPKAEPWRALAQLLWARIGRGMAGGRSDAKNTSSHCERDFLAVRAKYVNWMYDCYQRFSAEIWQFDSHNRACELQET